MTDTQPVHTRALIIGSGFSGLGMAIALQKQGVDFVILEKADEIGGTWRDNIYPGCACDIPSHMYSFSFEPKPDWRHMWSFQPEIFDYLKGVTDKYRLRPHIRFGSHVDRAHWDDAGLEVLILPRVVETAAQRDAYADALGEPVRVVRLDAPADARHARLLARHEPGPERDWHLARTDVLAVLLVTAGLEDLAVENHDRSPSAVALEIADRLGL